MKVTFIGGGNMATALISGLSQSRPEPDWIRVCDPSIEARERLATEYQVECFSSAAQAIDKADTIVLAIKPQVMPAVLAQLGGLVEPGQLLISIAAGVNIDTIVGALGADQAVIRAMPNTPALIGKGISGLFAAPGCSAEQRETAERLFAAAGASVWVEDEALMNVVTAVSGSGPAYYFLLTEALREAGQSLGLPETVAARLALHTANGAGAMALQNSVDVSELRRRVTSPGGTTQAALEVFASGNFRQLVYRAVKAASDRGEELATAGDRT